GGTVVKLPVKMTINGQKVSHEVEPRLLLVHYIREVVGLTGTHVGCDTSQCGACTILLGGQAVKACTMFAVQADGATILTIEGLAKNGGSGRRSSAVRTRASSRAAASTWTTSSSPA